MGANLRHDIHATLVIPCHYGLFEFNTARTELFEESCEKSGQECEILENGERVTLE